MASAAITISQSRFNLFKDDNLNYFSLKSAGFLNCSTCPLSTAQQAIIMSLKFTSLLVLTSSLAMNLKKRAGWTEKI